MKTKYALVRQVDRKLIAEHSTLRALPSLALMALLHGCAWAIVFLTEHYFSWYAVVVAVILLAIVQHHLLTLMHEGAHYLVHPDRKWNDRLSQAFCAFPVGSHLKDYRYIHLQHHRHSGDPEQDPEVSFYTGTEIGYGRIGDRLKKNLLNDLTGVNTLRSLSYLTTFIKQKTLEGKIRPVTLWDLKWGLLGLSTMLTVPLLFGFAKLYVILWVATFLTVTPLLVRWHSVGEHTGINAEQEQDKTLTHLFPFWVNLFLYPIKSCYHLEHHLFPQVPWYEMENFRNKILRDPNYRRESEKLTVDGFFFGKNTVKDVVLTK